METYYTVFDVINIAVSSDSSIGILGEFIINSVLSVILLFAWFFAVGFTIPFGIIIDIIWIAIYTVFQTITGGSAKATFVVTSFLWELDWTIMQKIGDLWK